MCLFWHPYASGMAGDRVKLIVHSKISGTQTALALADKLASLDCPHLVAEMVMSPENRALCYYYRNPPPGCDHKPLKWSAISKLVWNTDGKTHPEPCSVRKCVLAWQRDRCQRGRKQGWRKTTREEDQQILACFRKARQPLGSAVTARSVAQLLPRAVKSKLCLRTIRRRLAAAGFKAEKKLEKADLAQKQRLARLEFCKAHQHRTPAMWSAFLQGCGDLKDFTYYPRKLKAKFARYRCAWTYMKATEKRKAEFLKPRKDRMFKREEYKTVRKGKILGFTTSSGHTMFATCPSPWSGDAYARLVRRRVGPFFRSRFPDRHRIRILLDSEPLLHTDAAKAAYAEFGLEVLPGWPTFSPDLNPQENVWSWAEAALRKEEQPSDSFAKFLRKLLVVARRYPNAEALVPSMHARIQEVLRCKGAMTRY